MSSNSIGPQGAKHLLDGLKGNSSLTELDISNPKGLSAGDIRAEGAKYIAELLSHNHTIVKIK